MFIEMLYFRPDEEKGPDFAFNHIRELKNKPQEFERFLKVRELICGTLGVSDLTGAVSVLRNLDPDSSQWADLNQRLCVAMCKEQGIELDPALAQSMVERSMNTAILALQRFTHPESGLLADHASVVGQMSGPQEHHEPLALMHMILDPERFTQTIRFEAARKLELAAEALPLHLDEQQHHRHLTTLIDIFNGIIWNGGKVGNTEVVECVSFHDPASFRTSHVVILDEHQKLTLDPYRFYHRLRMRRTPNQILAMWEHRIKPVEDQLLKLMRRRGTDAGYSLKEMNDAIGMRLVFLTKEDALDFERFFAEKVRSANHSLRLIERNDSLENEATFNGDSEGSNSELEMLQLVWELDGIRFEMQLHTIRTYLDYELADGLAHSEYEVTRQMRMLLTLFPQAIYGLDIPEWVRKLLERVRENKLNSWLAVPPKRSQLKLEQRPFGLRRQRRAIKAIEAQMDTLEWTPKWIVSEVSAATAAKMLSEKIGCPVLLFPDLSLIDSSRLSSLIEGESYGNVLVLVAVSSTGQTVERMRQILPGSKIAALVFQGGKVDFAGEEQVGDKTWYHFS